MRKKIQDLVRGKFDYDKPALNVPGEPIVFEVLENSVYRGEFQIRSEDDREIRGLVECGNPHIICLTPQFDAACATVKFEYHAKELKAGCPDCGEFVIVSSSGEYKVPFQAQVIRYYCPSSIGKIKTLNDFSNLAKLNWEEALGVFQNSHFKEMLPDEKTKMLYGGLCQYQCASHEMEEFLIGIGKKERNYFDVDMPYKKIDRARINREETITVTKSQWGYLDIRVSADGDFLELGKTRLHSKDFTGKHAKLEFKVVPEKLHGGKNYGRILLETPFQTKEIRIMAMGEHVKRSDSEKRHQKEYSRFRLIEKYTDFCLGRMSRRKWAQDSCRILNDMIGQDRDNIWNHLFLCQVYCIAGQDKEAAETLERTQKLARDPQSPAACYRDYLKSLLEEGEEDDREELLEETKDAWRRYRGHPVLFYMLLHLEGSWQNEERRYRELKKYLKKDCASPVFYLEAYRLLKEYPSLLNYMDEVEFRIFLWAARQQVLTDRMIQTVFESAVRVRGFHGRFFWLLGRCWKASPTTEAVKVICVYLIKNGRYGEVYFPWFVRGVEKELKIAGLYEAYMHSWHKKDGDIPEAVLKYFAGNPPLPSLLKTRLYAYLVRSRDRKKDKMAVYEPLIREFAFSQIQKGNINDELAEIYQWMSLQTDQEEWKKLQRAAADARKIVSPLAKFSKTVVLQDKGADRQSVPILKNTSYVRISDPENCLLFEDTYGRRYYLKDGYRITRMFAGDTGEKSAGTNEKNSLEEQPDGTMALKQKLEEFADSIDCLDREIQQAKEQNMDVSAYQEQLLVRMLFTEHFVPDHEEYFAAVCRQSDTAQIRDAYVSYFSWRYLLYEEKIPEEVFEYLEYSLTNQRILNRCCEMAMLKYLCRLPEWSEEQEELFVRFFEEQMEQGNGYPFYQDLPEKIKRKYMIHDCSYLYYTGLPHKKLLCRITVRDEEGERIIEKAAREPFEGMYVTVIRRFADEEIRYEFYETEGNVLKSAALPEIPWENMGMSRYRELNLLLKGRGGALGDLEYYAGLCDMTEHLFIPL